MAISSILRHLIERYHFTSLPELNALLNSYNVVAETGAEGSRLKAFKGLMYGALDDSYGLIEGLIKASVFWFKPALATLEKRFKEGEAKRPPYRQRLVTANDWA